VCILVMQRLDVIAYKSNESVLYRKSLLNLLISERFNYDLDDFMMLLLITRTFCSGDLN
jgi:hypothetical protein